MSIIQFPWHFEKIQLSKSSHNSIKWIEESETAKVIDQACSDWKDSTQRPSALQENTASESSAEGGRLQDRLPHISTPQGPTDV